MTLLLACEQALHLHSGVSWKVDAREVRERRPSRLRRSLARSLAQIGELACRLCDFGAISVTERSCCAAYWALKWRVTYRIGVHIISYGIAFCVVTKHAKLSVECKQSLTQCLHHVYTIRDSSYADTKTISDRAFVHAQERWFQHGFRNGNPWPLAANKLAYAQCTKFKWHHSCK